MARILFLCFAFLSFSLTGYSEDPLMNELLQKETLQNCALLFRQAFFEFEQENKISFETKEDGSLVSNLEKRIEEIVGSFLQRETPWAGFQGEEGFTYDALENKDDYKWYLDPIDGTASFRNGLDVFAFTLTLVHKGKALATIIDFPRLNKTYTAYAGKGAQLNGNTISLKNAIKSEKGIFAMSDDYTFSMTKREKLLDELRRLPFITRTITDIYGYCMVAEGKCAAKFDAAGALWDLWPAHLLITEAGGKCLFFSVENPTEDLAGSMLAGSEDVIEKVYQTIRNQADILPEPSAAPSLSL